ncbi:MAG: xanthine dehydrogenase family protein molybdopterin-binding subunit [Bryobacterales bacterium]|nr:xanthine dehydrogenase family protein molybdopterin-binding subunit [Bryobacterales bacterium]
MPSAIGEPLDRVDGRAKVTGGAVYSAENNLPGMTYAVMVTSTIAKGRVASIDSAAARRAPGIIAVLTHESKLKLAKSPDDISPDSAADRRLQLLQNDRVLYAGQPVAVVVAETLEAAQEGARLAQVRYGPETPSVSVDASLAGAFIPERLSGAGDPGRSSRGDVQAGMSQASTRLEQVYTTPFQVHNPMEPHATVAVWDGPDGLTLYDATQGIFGARKRVAGLLGLAVENVRVLSPYVGGGFGSKGPTWSHVLLCAMAAREVRRPVKLVLARPQMFGPIGCRSETRQSIAIGAKPDGTLTALKNDVVTHTSSFDDFVEPASTPTRKLYSVPNNSTTQRVVRSDIGTPSYMRAPGEAPGTFALEVAMDELAYALTMDPLALRLKNYAEQDEDGQKPWSAKSLRECYRMGAERFGWAKRSPEPGSMRDGHTLIGWGLGTAMYPARRSPASARARLNRDGSIQVEAGTQEIGGGTYTTMTQIAADGIGVEPSRVIFRLGDTQFPPTPVSGGSMTTASTGSAVYLAARALRDTIIQRAVVDRNSLLYGAKPAQIAFENGRLSRSDRPGQMETIQHFAAGLGEPYIEAIVNAAPGQEKEEFSPMSFGAQFAEVRVDADLGQVFVSRMVGAFGAGRIINAKTARSNFMGGMVWGVSFALYEHAVYDERLGRIVNNNLAEYHVPVNADIGDIDVIWVDEADHHVDPIGAKGIGEIGITGSAAAVANAVFHATGKRVRDLPITLDKLL